MITLNKALSELEERKASLVKYVKQSNIQPSQELKDWVETLQISITLIKKEIENNGK